MLVLINEQIELHFSVTKYSLAFSILKLYVERLTSSSNIKSYNLFPDRITILRYGNLCVRLLAFSCQKYLVASV